MGFVENVVLAAHSIELIKTLIRNNPLNLNDVDKNGNTALLWACSEEKVKIAKLLIDAKVDVDKANKKEETPLTIASSDGQDDIVDSLIVAGADINKPKKNGWSPLMCAAYNGKKSTVELLLQAKVNINACSNVGCTALYWACNNDKISVVEVLLSYHADVNLTNLDGKTPLMVAAKLGRSEIVEVLLNYGANKGLIDNDGESAASLAVQSNRPAIAEFILSFAVIPTASSSTSVSETIIEDDVDVRRKLRDEITLSTRQLQLSQPLLSVDVTTVSSAEVSLRLRSLAEASPQVIEYLKSFGIAASLAEQQYQQITADPSLMEYYVTFNKNVSGAVLASQTISSGMVADARSSTSEQIVGMLGTVANNSNVMALPFVTSLLAFVVKIPNDIERIQTVKRITTCFPSVDSHKYIEMLARETTLLLAGDIKAVLKLAKKHKKASILNMVGKAVEWLSTYDNATPVQAYASMHTALLLDKLMRHSPPFTVQQSDIPTLIEWATGIKPPEPAAVGRSDEPEFPPPSSSDNSSSAAAAAAALSNVEAEVPSPPLPPLPPPLPPVEYAERELVDDRINQLMKRLEAEEAARLRIEGQLAEVKALSNKVQRLDALNEIFGDMEEGGLARSQNKASIAAAIESHFKRAAVSQNLTDETLRELVLQVQLIMESVNGGSPTPPRSPSPTPQLSPSAESPGIDDGDVVLAPSTETVGAGGCRCAIM